MTIKRNIHIALAAAFIMVPVVFNAAQAAVTKSKTESATVAQTGKVSINKADVKALMQVKGMSAYKAHAIVAYRNKNGEFKNTDELNKVKGFKRMKPEELKGLADQLLLD